MTDFHSLYDLDHFYQLTIDFIIELTELTVHHIGANQFKHTQNRISYLLQPLKPILIIIITTVHSIMH